jgi:hypothetical protein
MDGQVETRLIRSMNDRIYSLIGGPVADMPPAFDATHTFVQFLPAAWAMNASDFSNAVSPANPNGDWTRSEAFSRLIDPVPAQQSYYVPTSQSIDALYGLIVNGAVAAVHDDELAVNDFAVAFDSLYQRSSVTADPVGEVVQVGSTPIHEAYLTARLNYVTTLNRYCGSQSVFTAASPAMMDDWQQFEPPLRADIELAREQELASEGSGAAEAIRTLEAAAPSAVGFVLEQAKQLYSDTSIPSLNLGFPPWHLSYAFPSNWWDANAHIYQPYLFSDSDPAVSPQGGAHPAELESTYLDGLFRVGVAQSTENSGSGSHAEANHIEISLEAAFVSLTRPWLQSVVFSMGGWYLSPFEPGAISSGIVDLNETRLLTLLPVGLLVTRNIQIRGVDWSQQDLGNIHAALAGEEVHFGPFKLAGRFSASGDEASFASDFSDGTIAIPQSTLQVAAVVNQIVPFSPALPA